MLPSHNCIIIINVQFSRYIIEFQETQWSILFPRYFSQFLVLFWILVEISGIEPLTSCLQGRRSPSWAKPPNPIDSFLEVVGQNGLAFLRKSHAGCNSPPDCCQEPAFESIFELSIHSVLSVRPLPSSSFLEVVGQNGLEPSTSRLSVVCSSQLSYWPISAPHLLRYIP